MNRFLLWGPRALLGYLIAFYRELTDSTINLVPSYWRGSDSSKSVLILSIVEAEEGQVLGHANMKIPSRIYISVISEGPQESDIRPLSRRFRRIQGFTAPSCNY